jgi:hypothetical protein
MRALVGSIAVILIAGCGPSPEGQGLATAPFGVGAKVKFDIAHRPLPDIPFPNDFATRYDASSPTKRRINASMEASTEWEKSARTSIDSLDGWGTYSSITVGFDKPLDVRNIIKRHQNDDYDTSDDAVLVIDVSPDSPDFCQAVPLDMGEGNFPVVLERREYFPNDFHNDNEQLVFEEVEEDRNGNGQLDLGEDLDMDGVLDHPNKPYPDADRFDIMTFYERETNTLIMKPLMPMRENTTYAAVLTRRLVDQAGHPVRSPYDIINHASQTNALKPLERCLPQFGLAVDDVSFTWSFTTQSISRDFKAIRDGIYGLGPLSRLATEYPAEIKSLLPLLDSPTGYRFVVPGDKFADAALDILKAQGGDTPATQVVNEGQRNIAFHVVFEFESPQFFPRWDSEGNWLPLYKQEFQLDPVTGAAFTRPEKIYVWLTVPKRRNGPAPVVILGHGYTGNKLDPIVYGGFYARFGIATIGMENVSHGIGLNDADAEIGRGILAGKGMGAMFEALVKHHRAYDQNADGVEDSAADFWTAYINHTRDVVRQSAVDYMQLIKLLRSFDGVRRWDMENARRYDANGDGQPDIAGDFDGDGIIDVGGNAPINMTGGSLGGIMSALMGGVEPAIETIVPVSGAAGLADVGVRSIQGGVGEAVNLRMLGPLTVTLKNAAGGLDVAQVLPDLNDDRTVRLGVVPAGVTLVEGDTAIIHNLKSNEYRCTRVLKDGLLRASVSSDKDDPLKLEVYAGPLPPQDRTGCQIPEGALPKFTFDALGQDIKFQGREFAAGTPMLALGDGFGLRRQSAETRRFMGIAQLLLDKGDPINFAPNYEQRHLEFGTGEVVRTRAIVVNTIGDMNVPVAAGVSIARAAGFIDFKNKDPRYGKSVNRMLIDTGVLESVERTGRYKGPTGRDVLMDVDYLAQVAGKDDKIESPRLANPLRAVQKSDIVGGYSGALFPCPKDTGRHGFDSPNPSSPFDVGTFMLNLLGQYAITNGREFHLEQCNIDSTCPWIPPNAAPTTP